MTSIIASLSPMFAGQPPAPAVAGGERRGSDAELRFLPAATWPCEIEWEAIRTGGRLLMFGYGRSNGDIS